MELVVYGIPTCGTVKAARAFLDGERVAHRFVDMRAHPPSKAQIERWVKAFGARALRNTSGGAYRALPDEKSAWSDAEWTARFAADPMLIKRPVVEKDGAPLSVGKKDAAIFGAR